MVIGTAELTGAYQLAATRDFVGDAEWAGEATVVAATRLGPPLDTFRVGWGDCHFGGWDIGGWAWKLINVLPVEPFAAKGQLGLWTVDMR